MPVSVVRRKFRRLICLHIKCPDQDSLSAKNEVCQPDDDGHFTHPVVAQTRVPPCDLTLPEMAKLQGAPRLWSVPR